jgi:hypothetical protein
LPTKTIDGCCAAGFLPERPQLILRTLKPTFSYKVQKSVFFNFHMKLLRFLSSTFVTLLVLTFSAIAQNGYLISGTIKDSTGETLIGATVSLRNAQDSFVNGSAADIDGFFEITNVQDGDYKLYITYIGYDDYTRNIKVAGQNIALGTIRLSNLRGQTLAEVAVTEKAIQVQQKDDTTQFNAASYKVNPDATAEDLIRKMPGMDMSSGKTQAQGEDVKKVLVDGKPFFGDDPSSALKNLPAEVIDKIQVYDERSEQAQFTGFDDGNTSKTINIITKAGKSQGIFGRVYAGGGADAPGNGISPDFKYNGGGNINYFEGDRRISLIGLSNNVNVQNFSSQDLLGISGGSGGRNFGGGGRRGGGGPGGPGGPGGNAFNMGQQEGISKTNAIGLNYSDKWGKKIDVTGSYFFNNTDNVTEQFTNRRFVIPASQRYDDTSRASTVNNNHRFNLRLNYNIDSFNSLLFIPSISVQDNKSNSRQSSMTYNPESILNRSVNTYNSNLSGYNMSSMLLYRHKFKKQGRTFSLWANGGYNSNDGDTKLYAPFEAIDTSYTLDQEATIAKSGWNINSNLNYTEPLSKKSFLQVQYGLRYQQSESEKRTYNRSIFNNEYTDLDTLLSNTFTTEYLTNRAGLSYRFADSNFNFNIGADFQNANLDNVRTLPVAGTLSRSFNNILPSARLQYNFSKKKNLRLFYRTSTDAPSVDQLQDVVNNANPIQQSSGNPSLVQSYQHNLNMRYNATNTNVNSTFFAMLSGTATQDYIGNSTIIAQDEDVVLDNGIVLKEGQQFSRPENLDGYYNLRSFVTYGMPVSAIKSNLNVNASAGYVRTPGLINNQKNFANNTSLGLGLVLSSNISENIDFTLSSNSNFNIVNNTLNTSSDSRFLNQSTRLNLNYIFWKGIVFNTELNHQFYNGLAAGFNQNYLLWNMSLAKKLFKNRQGEIKITVYDLLKQNTSIVPTITETYTQNTQTNVLQQYFMLTFTYNLRFFKGGASMKDVENQDRDRGPNFGPPPGHMPGPGGMMPPPHGM